MDDDAAREQRAEIDGWERTMQLRWRPWEPPVLEQKWIKFTHGYGHDTQEERWLTVPTAVN